MSEHTSGRFRGFDGLRGVAILLVILWHSALATRFPVRFLGPLRTLVTSGWIGVDLFFALSGFLITSLLLREERDNLRRGQAGFSLGKFYLRRALRILPVFYAVFLLDTLVLRSLPFMTSVRASAVPPGGSPFGLWPYATFWGNYHLFYTPALLGRPIELPGNAYLVTWSLCVEEHFYLVWPLLLILIRRPTARLAVAAAACAGITLFRAAMHVSGAQPHGEIIHTVTHYRLDAPLWGSLAALVHASGVGLPARFRRGALAGAAALTVALLLGRQLSVVPAGTPWGVSVGLGVLALGSALLVLELAAAPHGPMARALEWRPLALVGRLSYAMYLIHFQAIDVALWLRASGPRPATVSNFLGDYVAEIAFIVPAAVVLHLAVERPFLALKSRYGRPGESSPAPTVVSD